MLSEKDQQSKLIIFNFNKQTLKTFLSISKGYAFVYYEKPSEA